MKLLILIFSITSLHALDPRLERPNVAACFEQAKRFLPSAEYSGENEAKVIGACGNADPLCVSEVGESYHPTDGAPPEQFLGLIRECRGGGMGKCFRALKDKTAAYDRREFSQLKAMLKKCK